MEIRQYYLQELKEQGVMVVKWKPGTEDILTCTPRTLQGKHLKNMKGIMLGMTITWRKVDWRPCCLKGECWMLSEFLCMWSDNLFVQHT